MGIDVGSVSLNIAITSPEPSRRVDGNLTLLKSIYQRTKGQPIPALLDAFNTLSKDFLELDGVTVTGSGRDLIANILGIDKENEIITQAKAVIYFHPEVRTVIEIGGQDSKLIFLEPDESAGKSIVVDHSLNEICAAGTGSFLDQQAYRLGISIEDEFGEMVLKSQKPAVIAGRCSVFAKSDMIHLQQEGTLTEDILAGLCQALARNYISNLGRGKRFEKPIAFQGGVAANKGVIKAFEELLELKPNELIIPEHFKVTGAIGSAIAAMEKGSSPMGRPADSAPFKFQTAIDALKQYLVQKTNEKKPSHLKALTMTSPVDGVNGNNTASLIRKPSPAGIQKKKAYLGIDVGASSVNIVVLDEDKNLLLKKYLLKEGEPINQVRNGLEAAGNEIKDFVEIQGVGVTGSARYFVGDFVGADLVINEITAQARAALNINAEVDTIFEIGGQDSKYIYFKNGAVVDFEMNKVCAAGTGSFLQEQANRLNVNIEEEFSSLACSSKSPADLGTRCTVFMESDLIHHQQIGSLKENLLAGLSYSIANNYIEKVVGNKKIGRNIYFQGGVAGNKAVVSAFENILGRTVTVPENYNVTGAIGAALIVMEKRKNAQSKSNFAGFAIRDRTYKITSFECRHCPNRCEIKQVSIGNKAKVFYGGICDRYDKAEEKVRVGIPDLFKEREEMLMRYYKKFSKDVIAGSSGSLDPVNSASTSPTIGIPRILMFFEQFPLWAAFFAKLNLKVVISDKTNSKLIHQGLREVLSETCYPVKAAYGHMLNLIEKGVDCIFLPAVIDLEKDRDDVTRSYNCPYIQAIPFILKAAFEKRVKIKSPDIFMAKEKRNLEAEMMKIAKEFGKKKKEAVSAVSAALRAQEEFEKTRLKRGKEILDTLKENNTTPIDWCCMPKAAIVVIGKPYNVHDTGLNLNIAQKLRKLGITAIPYDMLPLDSGELPSYYSNLVWKNEQNLLRAAIISKNSRNLHPVMITNYGCGPDAFFAKYLEDTMEEDPYLVLEVDEHSGDAGMVTRVEAFLDTLTCQREKACAKSREDSLAAGEAVPFGIVGFRDNISIFKPSKKIKELEKTIYIFNVSGHSDIWAAAFQSVGIDAKVLPWPDDQSEELGRKYASARECHPYLVTTGDMVKAVQSPGFNPDTSAFVMLNFDGSCRLSQYGLSQKMVLKRLGLSRVPVIAPITSIHRDDATKMFGINWGKAVWKGWLAADVLLKKLLHIRPHEVNKGETERVYQNAIKEISSGILNHSFSLALKKSIASMDAVTVKKEERPIIGIVGEFYTCMNSWANNDIIKELESLGTEVRYGPSTTDYMVYFNESYPCVHLSRGECSACAYYYIRRFWFMGWKKKIERMLGEDLYDDCMVPSKADRVKLARPYVTDAIDPVVTVNISKAKNNAVRGYSGIANLIVLNCLYGTLSTAIYKKIQREHNRIPILTIISEGLKPTNEKTRIEAFVHQVKSYYKRGLNA